MANLDTFLTPFDLSSKRWTQKILLPNGYHDHEVDYIDGEYETFAGSVDSDNICVFCKAYSTYDRNLEEILYHQSKSGSWKNWHKTLIAKWKNNEDAWGNPIGNNIKG